MTDRTDPQGVQSQETVTDRIPQNPPHCREQSEELRTAQARQLQREVCAGRAAQLRSQEEERLQRVEEERFFARLWEADRQAKEDRAELEGQRQRSSARQQRDVLCAQMEAAEQRRVQSRQLKEEQAQLLVRGRGCHGGCSVEHCGVTPCVCLPQREQQQLQVPEEQRERGRRRQEQQRMHRELDRALRLKMRRLAREEQEELALDTRILEELLQERKGESHEQERRKVRREKKGRRRMASGSIPHPTPPPPGAAAGATYLPAVPGRAGRGAEAAGGRDGGADGGGAGARLAAQDGAIPRGAGGSEPTHEGGDGHSAPADPGET